MHPVSQLMMSMTCECCIASVLMRSIFALSTFSCAASGIAAAEQQTDRQRETERREQLHVVKLREVESNAELRFAAENC